jgi:hypothetical protein
MNIWNVDNNIFKRKWLVGLISGWEIWQLWLTASTWRTKYLWSSEADVINFKVFIALSSTLLNAAENVLSSISDQDPHQQYSQICYCLIEKIIYTIKHIQ